ncbi:hypothetical protein [Duganella sp. S19_KUP01_CR8]|uniref:hypothetical protein n=1 Tax=Duganella sp. S19_KUP01_CR8 TaxID=3025502 RepID=UPI002FCDAD5F
MLFGAVQPKQSLLTVFYRPFAAHMHPPQRRFRDGVAVLGMHEKFLERLREIAALVKVHGIGGPIRHGYASHRIGTRRHAKRQLKAKKNKCGVFDFHRQRYTLN